MALQYYDQTVFVIEWILIDCKYGPWHLQLPFDRRIRLSASAIQFACGETICNATFDIIAPHALYLYTIISPRSVAQGERLER
jgi:hypothetical protein